MAGGSVQRYSAGEWRHWLLVCVSGLLVFETLSGLSIYLLPFSVPNQVVVIVHTLVGLVFVVPYVWYQIRHWQLYRSLPLTHVKLTGYFSLVAALALTVSGLVLTAQAAFATRISHGWDLVHVVATFALIASVLPHVLSLVYYTTRAHREDFRELGAVQRRLGGNALLITAGLAGLVALGDYAYPRPHLVNRLPADYSYVLGRDRPFAPSLARTSTGQAFDPRTMGGSAECGTSGCHQQIYQQWSVSAHRYSAMDAGFRAVQTTMGKQNGPESTRYCGGCHDPISLFAGAKNLYRDDLSDPTGKNEGVSCIVCHSIKQTDLKGNASYVITQPKRYLFELSPDSAFRPVRDFLIRAYPWYHVQSLSHRLFKSPEFCAACHKQFIDKEVNNVGWVQLQNQYDNWRKSRWNSPGDARKTIECRECHMPLVASNDPASGDNLDYNRSPADGKVRSHRFLASNQFMPLVLKLPGADSQVALTNEWLQGKVPIPEIADKWRTGPAIPISLVVPKVVRPGQEATIQVLITNNKAGHEFPTGPLDIIQAWLNIRVTDAAGKVVFASGQLDKQHFIQPGTFMFKAEPVDQYGKLIDRHNLWEMVGVRWRRAIFPGESDMAEYHFRAPTRLGRDVSGGTLHVSAELMYRKVDQFLLNFLFGKAAGLTAPVTVISQDDQTIAVRTQ